MRHDVGLILLSTPGLLHYIKVNVIQSLKRCNLATVKTQQMNTIKVNGYTLR